MFSSRVPRSLEPNRITQAVRRARADGRSLIDLTVTNPTTVGLAYSPAVLDPLTNAAALTYEPEPFGLLSARRAVACDYTRRGLDAPPERIVLTASTSEAYSLLFKLLCAPSGDAVMVPVPSYPLFDHLTALDGVATIPYRLDYHGRWTLATDDIPQLWTRDVRAVLAVSPNNPTGSTLAPDEVAALSAICAERGAALIVDEVFADYVLGSARENQGRAADCLTFRLGGLSKSAGLPQVKLGWIHVDGPKPLVDEALERLGVICDAYLSVSTPVQIAAPALIAAGAPIRAQIQERVGANYDALREAVARYPAIELLHADAGWSAVLRVPSTQSEEERVVELLERDRVLVHPGFFFDFPHEAFIIVSLLPPLEIFAEGVGRVLERTHA
jgi:aspartate/methionine/tyrosine aminotransferase